MTLNIKNRKRNELKSFALAFFVLLAMASPLYAQDSSSGEDYDVLVIPIGPSSSAPGRDLTSPDSLEARGLQIDPVGDFALGTVDIGPDRLTLHLKAGEALLIHSPWTEGIPLSATSAYFSMTASATGEPLQQAALALLDANNPSFEQGVEELYNQDIPSSPQELSMEYRNPSGSVLLLIQFVGPAEGETTVVLERMRLLDGYRELEFSLGSTAITAIESFLDTDAPLTLNIPPSTEGGTIAWSKEDRLRFPSAAKRSLQLSTQGESDVVQVLFPMQLLPGALEDGLYPRRFYAMASVKKLSGDDGVYTIAVASGSTTSVGYENHPVASLSTERWSDMQSPLQLSEIGSNPIFLIVQLQGGPADIVIDDVSIQARRNSMYLWDASVLSNQ